MRVRRRASNSPALSAAKENADGATGQPIADAYVANKTMPYNAPSWALTAALFAGRPKEGYFKLSGPGQVTVDGEGRTAFSAAEKGNHQYLIVDPAQKEKIVLAYADLATATKTVPRDSVCASGGRGSCGPGGPDGSTGSADTASKAVPPSKNNSVRDRRSAVERKYKRSRTCGNDWIVRQNVRHPDVKAGQQNLSLRSARASLISLIMC